MNKIASNSMRTRVRRNKRRSRKTKRGGHRQYLNNVGFSTSYEAGFDPSLLTPSATRMATNWV